MVHSMQLQCHAEDTSCHESGFWCPSLHSLQESEPQDPIYFPGSGTLKQLEGLKQM